MHDATLSWSLTVTVPAWCDVLQSVHRCLYSCMQISPNYSYSIAHRMGCIGEVSRVPCIRNTKFRLRMSLSPHQIELSRLQPKTILRK